MVSPPDPPRRTPGRWRTQEIRDATGTDEKTGELIELGTITGMIPVVPRRGKARKEIKFMMIDIEAMPALKMSKGQWQLFWNIISFTDRERGEARVSTGELAKAMGWHSQNTSRALTELRERNIIIREGQGIWRVNPRLMSRKDVAKWELEMAEAPRIDWDGE
jgi:hypothetical protein